MPLPNTTISPGEVLLALREAIAATGSQRTYASSIGVSQAYLGDVLHGRRAAGDKILAAIGLRRITLVVAQEDVR
jgi:DNA-binding transcriptional regulator YdaS (Cro superfamily)